MFDKDKHCEKWFIFITIHLLPSNDNNLKLFFGSINYMDYNVTNFFGQNTT